MDAETKTCSKCGEVKPLDAFSGYRTKCKLCRTADEKVRRNANLEKCRAAKAAYYEANSEKVRAAVKAYREANPEKVRARKKSHYEANSEKVLAKCKTWREAHPEMMRAYKKAYKKLDRSILGDSYVKSLITQYTPMKEVPQDLIDMQREKVATLREVKRLIEALKEIQND